jgi:hypothetical protein
VHVNKYFIYSNQNLNIFDYVNYIETKQNIHRLITGRIGKSSIVISFDQRHLYSNL